MPRPFLRHLVLSFGTAFLAAAAVTADAAAQVRMNLRNTTQIDALTHGWIPGATVDERFWPLEVNDFAHGDVDGDGDLDLLAAVSGFGTSRLWLNDGSGAFVQFVDIPWVGARCVLFDADGDGDLDALIGGGRISYGGATATGLFLNDGSGAFSYSPTTPTSPSSIQTRSLSVGDVDGDGDLDVLFFGEGPTPCLLWRNVGGGVFVDASANVQPPILFHTVGTFTDIEPDGDLDIVFRTTASGPCETRVNDGTGVFGAGPPIAFSVPSVDAAVADVDGDGLLDQVGVRPFGVPGPMPTDPVVWVRRNTGSGFVDVTAAWFEPHALVDHTVGWDALVCEVFDVDGDGDPDLVTGGTEQKGPTSTTVGVPPKVFLNVEGQRFLDAGRPAFPFTQDGAAAMDAGDIDGDGDVDLVTFAQAHYGSASADVWRQDGAGRFAEAGFLPFSSPHGFSALRLADVDGDGDLDLFGINGYGQCFPGVAGQHRLALNDGSGNFTDVTATHMPVSANTGGASCAVGDVDGDGDLDIVIGSYEQGWGGTGVPLLLLLNDGSGVFTNASAQLPSTPLQAGHTVLCDFDGDGDLDLVAAVDRFHSSTRRIVFFANNGAGVFTDESAARLPSSMFSWGVSVLDLDHDGDLDIAQSDVDLVNDGTGHFVAANVAATRLVVEDLDRDGVVDAIEEIGSQSSGGLRVVGGAVVFGASADYGHTVLPVDLDNDGDLDLVVATLRDGGNPDLRYTRCEVIYNLRRDMRVLGHPRLGQPYRMHLRATNGSSPTLGIVCIAAATLPLPVEIPGWGKLILDPAAIIPWTAVVVPDSDTAAEAVLPIPDLATFHGLALSCQSLLIPVGAEQHIHLTNGVTLTVER
ncbi:MAG: VCBS repeat-containing protein [Planctomycetes bacterium]|nr:VCBS repeat-containing protein [Planctomycetota bacterium]